MTAFRSEAFIWIWLPGKTEPVVAGRLTKKGDSLSFNYGRSYLERKDAISIHEKELPLREGIIDPLPGLSIPNCIRDGSPDSWGRRVILNRKLGRKGKDADTASLDELTYMLESGSDRIGALDFQESGAEYVAREAKGAGLEDLLTSAALVEKGVPLTPELAEVLQHGTSIGGARPKAQIEDGISKYIAKFSSSTDIYNVVKAEFVAMRLAEKVGLNVAPVMLQRALGKDVLLVERFDRTKTARGWTRKCIISALTLFELDEMMARYASYNDLAEKIRHQFKDASGTLKELFGRLSFNVLSGNTDDHARNHAAFWDGKMLELTPAYDICPQSRTGSEANQAMQILDNDKRSKVSVCLEAAEYFQLSRHQAFEIVSRQIETIVTSWSSVCDEAELQEVERKLLGSHQFLNPYLAEDLVGSEVSLAKLIEQFRRLVEK